MATACIYIYFCISISGYFDILRSLMNDMKIDEFIIYHLEIIDITNRLNSIFMPIIFILYSVGTALIVVLGLIVITADNLLNNIAAVVYAPAALVYFAIYSYGSQKIMDSSEAICDEAYGIDKDYLATIMIAQKKLRLTTPFFEISFETFGFMLSRSWSFIATAKSFV